MFSLLQQTAPAAVETTTAASEGARVTTITVPLGEPGAATAASTAQATPIVVQPVQSAPMQTVTTTPATTDAVVATPVTTTVDPVAVAPATDTVIAPVQADAGLAHTATTPVDTVIATPDGAHAVVTQAAPGADAAHAVTAGGHEAAATASAGMPQLDFSTFGNQIFWLLVTLVVIYLILSRVALPRISRILADRQGLMTSDLAAAEELKRKARDAEAAYDRALAEARTEAGKIVAANKAEIDAGLKAAMERADAEISARTAESERRIGEIRASAVDDARTVARDVAADLLRAFGGKADAAAVDAAVDARLKGAVQ